MIVPSFSSDTSLVLDKVAAINQSNFNIKSGELRNRFAAALKREERLLMLWEETTIQLEDKESIIALKDKEIAAITKQLKLREEQLLLTEKVYKKQKRKNTLNGILIGALVGSVGTALIITR